MHLYVYVFLCTFFLKACALFSWGKKVKSEMSDQKEIHMTFHALFIYSLQFYYVSASHNVVNVHSVVVGVSWEKHLS